MVILTWASEFDFNFFWVTGAMSGQGVGLSGRPGVCGAGRSAAGGSASAVGCCSSRISVVNVSSGLEHQHRARARHARALKSYVRDDKLGTNVNNSDDEAGPSLADLRGEMESFLERNSYTYNERRNGNGNGSGSGASTANGRGLDMMTVITQPVASEMQQQTDGLRNVVGERHPLLTTAAEHLFQAGGKRVRPLIAILVAKATRKLHGMPDVTDEHIR